MKPFDPHFKDRLLFISPFKKKWKMGFMKRKRWKKMHVAKSLLLPSPPSKMKMFGK